MALLFVVGVMNVLWIALLALLVLLEKLTPWGRWVARIAGAVCIAAGAWMVFSPPYVRSADARNEIRSIGCRSRSGPFADLHLQRYPLLAEGTIEINYCVTTWTRSG
jgi:cytochrome c biogenesis protein CcdA